MLWHCSLGHHRRLASQKIWGVLRNLRHYLRAQNQGHHTIDRLAEKRVERGSAQRSSLRGRKRAIANQTKQWNCFKGNIGESPERRGGAHMGFPECVIYTILNWTELSLTNDYYGVWLGALTKKSNWSLSAVCILAVLEGSHERLLTRQVTYNKWYRARPCMVPMLAVHWGVLVF